MQLLPRVSTINDEKNEEFSEISLGLKIDTSNQIIKEAMAQYPRNEICLAWTGGKDSTVMLWLYRECCRKLSVPMPEAMFIDEGNVFEEIIDLVALVKEQWGINVTMVKNHDVADKVKKIGDSVRVDELNEKNRAELKKIGYVEDTFAFEPESYVGNHLMKTVAMNSFLIEKNIKALSTAIRWDEQDARNKEEYFSQRPEPAHTRVHPILHFNERDIWEVIHRYKIPYCTLYNEGYRSLGAKGSTTKVSDLPAWEQDLENTPERAGRGQDKEQIMAQLRDLGYM